MGLIKQALEKYPSIDISQSFFCGDSLCDMELAKSLNIRFFGINLNSNTSITIASLKDILNFIK
jgi:D-glycero-D-manno-heptose 1,7-bisphosphate phosphatase